MKGIYLCAFYANHPQADLDYQDRFIERDIGGDCLDVKLDRYDYIIATPPCNYWSREIIGGTPLSMHCLQCTCFLAYL